MAQRQPRYADARKTHAELHQTEQLFRPIPQNPPLHSMEPRAILDSALYRKAESALKELLSEKNKGKTALQTRKPPSVSSPEVTVQRLSAFSTGQSRSASNRPNDARGVHEARGQFLRAILNSVPTAPKLVAAQKTDAREKEAKQQAANSLKSQLLQRFRVQDPEEPPHDLLSMSVLERSKQFLQQREVRRREQTENKKKREVEECTFHPILYTQISPKDMKKSTKELLALSFERASRPRERTRSLSRPKTAGYSQIHQRTRYSDAETPRSQPRRRSSTNVLLSFT